MQTTILVSLIGSLLVLLLAVIGFGAKRWFDHVEGLQTSMDKLRDTILNLSKEFVTQTQYRSDMENLRLRRAGDSCPKPDCPFDDAPTNPGVHITGSGAKSIADLLEAAKGSR